MLKQHSATVARLGQVVDPEIAPPAFNQAAWLADREASKPKNRRHELARIFHAKNRRDRQARRLERIRELRKYQAGISEWLRQNSTMSTAWNNQLESLRLIERELISLKFDPTTPYTAPGSHEQQQQKKRERLVSKHRHKEEPLPGHDTVALTPLGAMVLMRKKVRAA